MSACPFPKFWDDLNRAAAPANDADTFILEVVAAATVSVLLCLTSEIM